MLNLAILISGSGITLQNLIDKINDKTLNANIQIVISSAPDTRGIKRAEQNSIPVAIVERKGFDNSDNFSNTIINEIEKYSVDLIILAGFLHLFKIPDKYTGKVMNIHPGLIPSFCGKGYYGHHVHEAVIHLRSLRAAQTCQDSQNPRPSGIRPRSCHADANTACCH